MLNRTTPPARRARWALLSASGLIASTTLALATALPAAAAENPPVFEVPFPCGEVWQAATRGAHGTGRSTHFPLDFNRGSGAEDRGATIVSSANGTVVAAGGDALNEVEIDHGSGWTTKYLHMESVGVNTGDEVRSGDAIGTLGDRGSRGAFHLHFEQLRNGQPQHITFRHQRVGYNFVYTGSDTKSQNCRPEFHGGRALSHGTLAQWLHRSASATTESIEPAEASDEAATDLADVGVELFTGDPDLDAPVTHARLATALYELDGLDGERQKPRNGLAQAEVQDADEPGAALLWLVRTGTVDAPHLEPEPDSVNNAPVIALDPEAAVSREHAALIMHRLADEPPAPDHAVPPYTDMPAGEYGDAVAWLRDAYVSRARPEDADGDDDLKGVNWFGAIAPPEAWDIAPDEPEQAPDATVTKEVVAAQVYQMAGQPQVEPEQMAAVPDVATSHEFSSAIHWVAAVSSDEDAQVEEFVPEAPMTRGEFAKLLYGIADAPAMYGHRAPTFVDIEPEHSAADAVEWLAKSGIAEPFKDGTFRPEAHLTNAELDTLLRGLERVERAVPAPTAAKERPAVTRRGAGQRAEVPTAHVPVAERTQLPAAPSRPAHAHSRRA